MQHNPEIGLFTRPSHIGIHHIIAHNFKFYLILLLKREFLSLSILGINCISNGEISNFSKDQ